MNRRVSLAALFVSFALAAPAALAQQAPEPNAPRAWDAMQVEKIEALELVGDVENGKAAYAVCASCHLPNGAGRPDGAFPQLAGQHESVLIKQIADIRAGRRDNPIMAPFAAKLADAQELADVAAYIGTLPIPTDNGKGPGTALAKGEQLYARDCVPCHGAHGEGSDAKLYPVLAGQHYEYALRQLRDIAGGRRRNANPDMVKIVRAYKDDELQAVADWATRLSAPPRAQVPAPGPREERPSSDAAD